MAVVVVSWEARALTLACVERLREHLEPGDELVVVDNGSTDGTTDALAAAAPHVRVVVRPTNEGFAGGANAGIDASTSPWILTLNNDAWLEQGALARLREAARTADQDVAALQPLLLFDRAGTDVVNSTGIRLLASGGGLDRDVHRPRAEARGGPDVFGVTAGAALYRRAALDDVRDRGRVFDPAFFLYFEDVDLAWRLRRRGWQSRYVPEAVARHAFQASSRRHGDDFVLRQCMRNRLRCLLRNASAWMLLTTLRRTGGELVQLTRRERSAGLRRWLGALGAGLAARHRLGRRATVSRRAVERRWRGR
ncbi:MAG: glycosyltransferase family 2 protein [Planctomycetota bacterium]